MSAHVAGPYRLSIPSAGTDSPALSSILSAGQLKVIFGGCTSFTIHSLAAAFTGTITVQVVSTEGAAFPGQTLQSNGADITLVATKATPFFYSGFRDLRIHSSGAEAGQRDFDLLFQIAVTS